MKRGKTLSEAKKPYQWAMDGMWTTLQYFYMDYPKEIVSHMTTNNDTALHFVASNCRSSTVLKKLIELINEQRGELTQALMMENNDGNTPLHEAAASGNMEAAQLLVKEDKTLLERRNKLGESPLYRAAAFGHTNFVEYFRSEVHDIEQHFTREKDGLSILHTAVIAQNFETALWLQKNYPDLANAKENNGLTSLQLLAQMPNAFQAESIWRTLIYKYFFSDDNIDRDPPNQNYDSERRSNQPHQSNSSKKIPELLLGWRPIRKMFEEMQNQKVVSKLTDLLVKEEYSWGEDSDTPNIGNTFCLLCSNEQVQNQKLVSKLTDLLVKEEYSWGKDSDTPNIGNTFCLLCSNKQVETSKSTYKYTPLLAATCTGILQIVKKIINFHPQAIEARDIETQENILHMAIKHRQLAIFDFVKTKKTMTSRLAYRIDSYGNSILHHAADMKFYTVHTQRVSGPAFQLQEELRWLERVEEILPRHYAMHQNKQGLTAQKLFENKHAELLNLAKAWIKETAQSCSTVAALVATVAYAAAFTAPGGNDDNGVPVLRHSPFFVTFAYSDTISLIFSLTSLCTFLSILTSPFEYNNFRRSLPVRLHLGFAFLFFSLVATMVTFTAAVVLLIRYRKMWKTSLIYVVALLPVSVFGLLQFPLYDGFRKSLEYISKKMKPTITLICDTFVGLKTKISG